MRLIKRSLEYLEQGELNRIPKGARGICVLYKRRGAARASANHYDVVYVGLATRSIKSRIRSHLRNKQKLWSHFSFYEVWDNIQDSEIAELEGLFRHLYRFDSKANSLNSQKAYRPLNTIRKLTEKELAE